MPKTWFITGSARGLGRALAEAVLASGDNLVATARRETEIGDLQAKYGNQVLTHQLDVADYDATCKAVETALERFGRLDVMANVAGYGNLAPIEDTSIDDFRAQINTGNNILDTTRKIRYN